MTPALVEAVVDHLDRLHRADHAIGDDDHLVQSRTGGSVSRERIGTIVNDAAELATKRRAAEGLPRMLKISPHSLRRAYISIALRANQFDVKGVMSQVGHADSWMTMEVHAQLEQRVDRVHGENRPTARGGVTARASYLAMHRCATSQCPTTQGSAIGVSRFCSCVSWR